MKKIKLVFLVLLAVVSFNSCSKDDDKSSTDEAIDGGTVHTSEMVRIASEGLSQKIYEAIFNGSPVQLANNDQGELLFFVKADLAKLNENNVLEIPALEMTINYKVVKTTLTATPEETLAPLIETLNDTETSGFAQGDKVQQFIDSFNNYYASLSASDKTEMAEFYQANSELFGLVMPKGGRSNVFLGLNSCETSVWAFTTFAAATVILFNPASVGPSAVAMVGAITSLVIAVNECDAFRTQGIKQIYLKFGNIFSSRPGQNNVYSTKEVKQQLSKGRFAKNHQKQPDQMLEKNTNEALILEHGEPQSFTAANGRRSLQTSDASDTNPIITEFFSLMQSLNNFVLDNLNSAITYFNNEVPSFFEIDLFDVPISLPENGDVELQALDQEVFNAFTFSVGSEEVELDAINFANGEVSLTLNMADPTQDEISTTLDYVFHDDFNDRNGSFPIVVSSVCADSDLAVTATATGDTATATATGGTPPYSYSWSNGATGSTTSGLGAGEYTVTVMDSAGCTATASVTVEGDPGDENIFTDAAAVKAIRSANGLDVSDPRWNSNVESEVISVLEENGCSIYNNRVYYLDMENLGLTILPSEIGNLTNLEKLNLERNQLINIPPEIWNLTSLTELGFDQNQLTSIPPEIGNLTNLMILGCGQNQLTSIPSEIGNLIHLNQLYLHQNQLTNIPISIGNLGNLTYLDFFFNQLTSVPSSIGNLTNLTALRLDNNQLTSIPTTIGNLVNLIELNLDINQLTNIPSEIGNLTNLTSLHLQYNQLTSIPTEIGNLTNLNTLSLYGNQLISIPSSIWNMTNLTSLGLGDNQLTSIPSTVENLVDLTSLSLRYNQLTSIPPSIGNLINLEHLSLDSNQLTFIPSEIGNLTNLTYLTFASNELKCAPQSVWDLDPTHTIIQWWSNSYSENGETYGLCYFGDTDCSDAPCE